FVEGAHYMAELMNPFGGVWTYRSFRNNPEEVGDLTQPENVEKLKKLLFGEGVMTVEDAPVGVFSGIIDFGGGYQLQLRGSAGYGSPFTLRFQGVGLPGGAEGWVYDYLGYLVPLWPNGI